MTRRGAPTFLMFIFMRSRLLQTAPCLTMGRRSCRKSMVHGKGSCSSDHEEGRDRQHQQGKFESLSFLSSIPVHEKAKMAMHRRYSHNHVCGNSENSDSRQEANDQTHSPEKFSSDCQEGQRGRNLHTPGKESHRAAKSRSA